MKIYDPKKFGEFLSNARQKAGVPIAKIVKETGVSQGHYLALENGACGYNISDEVLDELMDLIPGFSLALADGVFEPGRPLKDM